MARRRTASRGADFNSFNDILTCLAGVMVLIIILVVIDAKQSKVLIPTPLEQEDDSIAPIYIELDMRGQIMLVDVPGLERRAQDKLEALAKEADNRPDAVLQLLAENRNAVGDDYYFVDLPSILTGNIVLLPKSGVQGFDVPDVIEPAKVGSDNVDYYIKLLQKIDKNTQYISFIVRSSDESFDAFRKARATAWLHEIRVAYEVYDKNEPLRFGLGGSRPGFQ
jgi:biopolymer transport protein ExbD